MVRPDFAKWGQTLADLRRLAIQSKHERTRERFQALYMIGSEQSNATAWAKETNRSDETVLRWIHTYYSGPQCQDHETREIRYGVGVRKGTDFVCSRRPSPSQAGVSTEATGLSRAGEGVGEAASDHPFPGSSRPLTGQRPVLCCGPDGRGRRRAVPLLFEFRAGAGCCSPGTRAITERFLAGKHRLACDSPGSGESAGGCRNRSSVPARSGGQAQSHSP